VHALIIFSRSSRVSFFLLKITNRLSKPPRPNFLFLCVLMVLFSFHVSYLNYVGIPVPCVGFCSSPPISPRSNYWLFNETATRFALVFFSPRAFFSSSRMSRIFFAPSALVSPTCLFFSPHLSTSFFFFFLCFRERACVDPVGAPVAPYLSPSLYHRRGLRRFLFNAGVGRDFAPFFSRGCF